MEKLLVLIALLVILNALILLTWPAPSPDAPDISRLSTRATAVVDLDHNADIVTLEDSAGFIWKFHGCEDYAIGDVVTLLLWNSNNTPNILDDVILSAQYSGYTISDLRLAKQTIDL